MEQEQQQFTIYYDPRPFAQRLGFKLMFWLFVIFCVRLSLGSIWWTFFFGLLVLFVFLCALGAAVERTRRMFNTKEELQKFIDTLP